MTLDDTEYWCVLSSVRSLCGWEERPPEKEGAAKADPVPVQNLLTCVGYERIQEESCEKDSFGFHLHPGAIFVGDDAADCHQN